MVIIVAPYDRGEVTAAAVRLAELGHQLGLNTRLVAEGPCRAPVHPYWDSRVTSSLGNGIYKAARGADQVIWFIASEHVRQKVDLVTPKARHIFVPTASNLKRVDAEWLAARHTDIVCPSLLMASLLKERLYPKKQAPVTWARWVSGLDHVQRIGLVNRVHPRLLVHCDASVVDNFDNVVLPAVGNLLTYCPNVVVSLVALKSWETKGRRRLRQLTDRYGARVQLYTPGSETDQFPLFHQHDWGLFPSPRADFGMYLQHARACGLTAITFDVPPYNELMTHDDNGILLACHTVSNWLGLPSAMPNVEQLTEQLVKLVPDHERLESLQKTEWKLVEVRAAFNAYWARLFGED